MSAVQAVEAVEAVEAGQLLENAAQSEHYSLLQSVATMITPCSALCDASVLFNVHIQCCKGGSMDT